MKHSAANTPPTSGEIPSLPPLAEAIDTYLTIEAIQVLPQNIISRHKYPYEPIPAEDEVDDARKTYFRNQMEKQYALLEPLTEDAGAETSAKQPPTFLTVCMPVAILSEDQATITRALKAVQQSQQALGKPVEVIVWANARYGEDDQTAISQQSNERYQQLRETLQQFDDSGLRIQTALQVLPENKASMSQLRANYMEAVAIHAEKQGYGYDHPVLWLDADVTYLTRNTLGLVGDEVRKFNTLFVHPRTRYTADWAEGRPPSDLDDATKAVLVNELYQRQINKKWGSEHDRAGYLEESGLAFALGTYLDLAGVQTADPVNESVGLTTAAQLIAFEGGAYALHMKRGTGRMLGIHDRAYRPEIERYIPEARMGLSARQHRLAVQQYGAAALIDTNKPGGEGGNYELFSHNKNPVPDAAPTINHSAMQAVIAARETKELGIHKRDAKQRRVLQRVIDANFSETPGSSTAQPDSAQPRK